MRKRTPGESQRGKSEAAQRHIVALAERAAQRRAELVARIVAELERRKSEALFPQDSVYPELAQLLGVSVNTVKRAVRESPRLVELKEKEGRVILVSLST